MFTVRILALAFVAIVVAEPEADPEAKKSSFNVESNKRWTLEDLRRSWNTDYYKQFTSTEAPKLFWSTTAAPKLYWSTTAAPKLFYSTTEAPKSFPYYNQYDINRLNGFNLYNRFADNSNKQYLESTYLASLYGNNYPQIPDQTNFQPQIICDKEQTQYILNLSTYKQLSLTVKVRGDFIYVQGREEITPTLNQNFVTLNQFVHTFVLPPYVRGNEVTAVLSTDGFLIITAPIRAYGYVSNVDYDVPVIISDQAYLQKPLAISIDQSAAPQYEPAQPDTVSIEANKEEQKPAEKPTEKPAETFQAFNYAAQQFPAQQKPATTQPPTTYSTEATTKPYPSPAFKTNPSYLSTVQVVESYSTQKSVEALPGQTYEITYTTVKPTLAVKPVQTLNPKSIVKVRPAPTQVVTA